MNSKKILKIYEMRLWRIFNYWIGKAFRVSNQDKVSKIGIDETSTKKGHNYVTIAVDMDKKNVIYATPEWGSDCVGQLKEHLSEKGCDKKTLNRQALICRRHIYPV